MRSSETSASESSRLYPSSPDGESCHHDVNATSTNGNRPDTTKGNVRPLRASPQQAPTNSTQPDRMGWTVLITRRSQVQILPPPPSKQQVRGPFPQSGEGLCAAWKQ